MLKRLPKIFIKDLSVSSLILIIAGSITWSLTMVKSGWQYSYGLGFWGPNGHDGVWHISIAESLSRNSLEMPIFAGEALKNYHFSFDLLVAMLHKITFIPVSILYFQIIPFILALAIGFTVYKFVLDWKKSKLAGFWGMFFVYFGGSFGWIVNLVRSNKLGGESMFWSQQSISTLINPPFALSVLLVFVGMRLLYEGIHKKNNRLLGISTLIFGFLISVKVYAGLLILGGLLVAGLYQMIIKREGISLLKIFSGSLVIALVVFLPFNVGASSSLVWKPFWFIETMMQLSDRVGWERFGEAMINYRFGNQWIKAGIAYTVAFVIFVLGNFGSRIIGVFYVSKKLTKKQKTDYVDVLFVSIIAAGVIMPLIFVQKGTPWNTIQFLYYSLLFSGILAGTIFGQWMDKKRKAVNRYALATFLIFFTIPTTYSTLLLNYLPSRPPAKLSGAEMEALEFLSRQPQGTVLTFPFDTEASQKAISNPPRPLYLYESTAYVSAFSQKNTYLEDEVNLNITGYDWPDRRRQVEDFLATPDRVKARDFLRENTIEYIYWVGDQRALLGESQLGLEKMFENSEVNIYRVVN